MGSTGSSTSEPKVAYEIDNERYDAYWLSDEQRESMKASTEEFKSTINDFMNDPWGDKDEEHLYEYLADAYPRSLYSDDAEKITWVDEKNEFVTTVRVSTLDNTRTGKLEVNLRPASYPFGEFTKEQLRDMGIERR